MTMFKTALVEERAGPLWDLISGFVAFAVLLAGGYFLIS